MVFNTGAALLDAIVLAIVSRDQEGTYGYKITQDVRNVIEISESTFIRYSEDCRRKSVWRFMIWHLTEETEDIIGLRKREEFN